MHAGHVKYGCAFEVSIARIYVVGYPFQDNDHRDNTYVHVILDVIEEMKCSDVRLEMYICM